MNMDRREFLETSTKVIVACCFLPSVLEASEARLSSASTDNHIVLDLSAPENAPLKSPGGAVFMNVKTEKRPIIVWRESESSVKAFSSACSHKGVQIELPGKDGAMKCPAHGARFDKNGKAITGPAKEPLKSFPAKLDANSISIEIAK